VPKRDDDDDVDIAAEQSSNVANATTTESATSNNASTSDVSSVPGLDVASGGVTESFVTPAPNHRRVELVQVDKYSGEFRACLTVRALTRCSAVLVAVDAVAFVGAQRGQRWRGNGAGAAWSQRLLRCWTIGWFVVCCVVQVEVGTCSLHVMSHWSIHRCQGSTLCFSIERMV
jgi:hypothetical protein